VEKYGTARKAKDNIMRNMGFAFWVTTATKTHPEKAILTDFPRQQWFRERASNVLYTLPVLFKTGFLLTSRDHVW
jgi:hypothetical protein